MTGAKLIISGEPAGPRLELERYRRQQVVEYADLDRLSARLEVGSELVASTGVETLGGDGLPEWIQTLAGLWRGWAGEHQWRSLEEDLYITATHDGLGHVSLRMTLRGPFGFVADAWEASATVRIDAGEGLARLAVDAQAFFTDGR